MEHTEFKFVRGVGGEVCEACGDDGAVVMRAGWKWYLCERCQRAVEWWEND